MEEKFNLKEERKMIKGILSLNMKVTAYAQGVKDCLEIVKEQDEGFIKILQSYNPKVLVGDVYTDFNLIIDKLAGDLGGNE